MGGAYLVPIVCIATTAILAIAISSPGLLASVSPPFPFPLLPRHTVQQRPRLLQAGSASIRGRRPHQEDRILFAPSISLPASHGTNQSASDVGLFGVFDGHLGHHASDFAASAFTQRFLLHAFDLLQNDSGHIHLPFALDQLPGLEARVSDSPSNLQQLLKDALRRTILDLDAEFCERASQHGLKSGSTACMALLLDDRLLVANVGDSKALICSSCAREERETNAAGQPELVSLDHRGKLMRSKRRRSQMHTWSLNAALHGETCPKELSSDHRPDRPDERLRIEAAGGFVTSTSTLSRVNGQLAVSRSIGDIDFKRFGVISEPELSSWHHVSANDTYLVLASDGIFERITPQEVCNVLHAVELGHDITAVMNSFDRGPFLAPLPLPGVRPDSSAQFGHESTETAMPTISNAAMDACIMQECLKGPSTMLTAAMSTSGTTIGHIMAQILVEVAYLAGSMDNLSVLVIPLKYLVS